MKYAATGALLSSLLVLSVGYSVNTPKLLQPMIKAPPSSLNHPTLGGTPVLEPKEIVDYQRWKLVNPIPYYVPAPNAASCINTGGPHDGMFIKVYVNPIGQEAMLTPQTPHFPPGSVIVKEKMTKQDGASPLLLTAMIKHAVGYDPKQGDWEYLLMDGTPESTENRGKLSSCQACHVAQQEHGYVFRPYLPDGSNINNTSCQMPRL